MKARAALLAAALGCGTIPVLAQAPLYDPGTGELRLTPVKVGDVSYVATLKDLGGLTFKLQSAELVPIPPPACAVYDGASGTLTLLAVRVGAKTYRATLVNLGDYTFRVTMATEADALCITSQPSFRIADTGSDARFEVGAAGTELRYRWQRSDDGVTFADIAGAAGAAYTLAGAGAGDDGSSFRVVVAAREGTITSDAARLRVGVPVRRIAAGFGHVVARKANGTAVAWGNNNEGQLGDGTTTNRLSPVPVQGLTDIVSVAANQYFSLALKRDGTVWGWGTDFSGQIGDEAAGGQRTTPVQAAGLSRIVAIAAGGSFGLALHDDGTVYSWGVNNVGQLGSGATGGGARQVAAPVIGLGGVTKIVAGEFTAYAIKADGTLWGWGYNAASNRLLVGTTVNNVAAPVALDLPGGTGVTDASIGDSHQIVRKADGALLAWGTNNGRLGDGTTLFRATPVDVLTLAQVNAFAACLQHSLGAAAGTAYAWGMNTAGELGNGQTTGTVLTPQPIPGLTNVVQFACRTNASPFNVAVTTGGEVWTWGHNEVGQLGDGTTTLRNAPVLVPGLNLN